MKKEVLEISPVENAIGNNISQIAYIANAQHRISEDKIETVLQMQNDIMRLVRSVR